MKAFPLAVLTVAVLLGACRQSPLYEAGRIPGGTRDEIPRDGNGEPILSAVRPVPPTALFQPPPPPAAR